MSEWRKARLHEVIVPVSRPVGVASLDAVPFAGVRWHAEGVYPRPVEAAESVKTKTLKRLEVDDITYNRMWATKGAFGVVTDDAAGCLVTGDFPTFRADGMGLLPAFLGLVFFPNATVSRASRVTGSRHDRTTAFEGTRLFADRCACPAGSRAGADS